MSLSLDFTQTLNLSFLEAAYAGNNVGYELPVFIEISWANRKSAVDAIKGATKSFKSIINDRLEFWENFLNINTALFPETLLVCPWGGFMALVVNHKARNPKYYQISAFTGKKKPTKAFGRSPMMTGMPFEAHEGAYTLNQLLCHQKSAKPYTNPFSVNDVLYSSWGCEQTNVTFYQVTEVSGLMVTVRKIESEKHDNVREIKNADGEVIRTANTMTGKKVPLINKFTGEAITKKVSSNGDIKINSYEYAQALGFEELHGVRIYEAKNISSYA